MVAQRLKERRQLECALRVVEGDVAGLTRKWRHGRATVGPRRIEFTLYLPTGIRVRRPWAKPVVLLVTEMDGADRQPDLAELWSLNAATDVVRVRTVGGAVLEWAIQQFQREWAVAQVTQ
jgi:hypothetical protein